MSYRTKETKPPFVFDTRYYTTPPMLCPGGFRQRKDGEWMLRHGDQVRHTGEKYTLIRTWERGNWSKEFYATISEKHYPAI